MSLTTRLNALETARGAATCSHCGATLPTAEVNRAEFERLRQLPPAELEDLYRRRVGEPDTAEVERFAGIPVDDLVRLYRSALSTPARQCCASCGKGSPNHEP